MGRRVWSVQCKIMSVEWRVWRVANIQSWRVRRVRSVSRVSRVSRVPRVPRVSREDSVVECGVSSIKHHVSSVECRV